MPAALQSGGIRYVFGMHYRTCRVPTTIRRARKCSDLDGALSGQIGARADTKHRGNRSARGKHQQGTYTKHKTRLWARYRRNTSDQKHRVLAHDLHTNSTVIDNHRQLTNSGPVRSQSAHKPTLFDTHNRSQKHRVSRTASEPFRAHAFLSAGPSPRFQTGPAALSSPLPARSSSGAFLPSNRGNPWEPGSLGAARTGVFQSARSRSAQTYLQTGGSPRRRCSHLAPFLHGFGWHDRNPAAESGAGAAASDQRSAVTGAANNSHVISRH